MSNQRPIKILRIINRLNIGGPTYNVAYLSKFIEKPFETKILAGMIEPGEGSSVYVLESLGLEHTLIATMFRRISLVNDLKSYNAIRKIINEFQPDIVHTHAAKAGALGRIAARFSKHKPKIIIHTYHGNIFDGYFSPLKSWIFLNIERILARFSTAIISISNQQRNELIERYSIAPASKIRMIPLGFMLDHFNRDIEKKNIQIRAEFKIPLARPIIVITGRLTAIKNHRFFIDVVCHCKRTESTPFTSLIVGDGELRSELIEYARNAGLNTALFDDIKGGEDIIFTSFRKDIDAINAAADIVVLTSRNEGTPVSIIEAMATSKAVITTPVGGVSDFITSQENGVICEEDVPIFAYQINQLLKHESHRLQIGKSAQLSVVKLFDYRRLVADMQELYNELLTKPCL